MRVTWLVVCEKIAHLADGSHHALRLYLSPIPWRPPAIHLPVAAAFLIQGDEAGPIPITVRLLNPRGVWVQEITSEIAGRPTAPLRAGFLDVHVKIDSPGDWELQVLVTGQAVDDAPTWKLRFLADRPAE